MLKITIKVKNKNQRGGGILLDQVRDYIYSNFGETLENRILDNYMLADGTYIIVKPDGNGQLKEFYRAILFLIKSLKKLIPPQKISNCYVKWITIVSLQT